MITRVRVKNFRSLADVDVTLGPLTVLVGRNGAGKSAFVDALNFLRDALHSGIDEAMRKRNGLRMLQTRHADGLIREIAIEVSIKLENFSAEYGFAVASREQGAYSISHEFLRVLSGDTSRVMFEIKNGQMEVFNSSLKQMELDNVGGHVAEGNTLPDPSPVYYFNFDPARLILPQLSNGRPYTSEMPQIMRQLTDSYFYGTFPLAKMRQPQSHYHDFALFEDGSNLASLLKAKHAKGVLRVIKAALQSAVPDIEDLRIDEIGSYLVIMLKHKYPDRADGEQWFDLAQESDGTIHLLIMLTALYQTLSPGLSRFSLIAIEEPETALYPALLSLLSEVIEEASCRSQILITTQSPDFISEFGMDMLRIVEKVDGATHIGPLDKVQAGVLHDQLFTTGDLLRVEGLRSLPAQPVSAADA